ncbi:hypothetical protein G9A89_010371 [Geosiphon pyriformis]|nr:hypothetical protein G9A89_010371 [Geosiphon pyriformis]
MGHTSLNCSVDGNFSPGKSPHKALLDVNKSRLAAIYSKHLAKIAGGSLFPLFLVKNDTFNPGFSSEMKSTLLVTFDIEKKFAVLESSLTNLMGQISELAKRLDLLVPVNQVGNIMMEEGLSVVTSSKAVVLLKLFFSPDMVKFENMLEGLSTSVLSLLVCLDGLVLAGSKIATCNVRDMNNPTKQEDIVYWYIINKFDGIRIFLSGVDKRFFGAGMTIIMNNSLAHHVSKIDEISGRVILVHLFFKGKLSVMVLGLYADTSSGIRFGQAVEVNFFVTRALNSSTFVVLDSDFNENNSKKSASFRFCLDLGLANSFGTYSLVRAPILSLAVAGQIVASVSDYFDTDHKTVIVSVGLGELLNVHLNVAKLVKSLQSGDAFRTGSLLNVWLIADELMNNELVLDSGEVKSKVDVIIERWTRKWSASTPLSTPWACQYAPLQYVNNDVFSGVMDVIGFDELFQMVKHLPDGKAAGFSSIPNELWKHYDESPIFTVGSVVKNALKKGRKVWLVLQNMCKAYDSVGWHHLEISLQCIKMCSRFIKFFDRIHENRLNCVITDFGLSDGYQVLDGLDQVSSVLRSSLYYDQIVLLKKFGMAFCNRLLDKYGRVLDWQTFCLLKVWSNSISVFTNGSLRGLGSNEVAGGAAKFFSEVRLGIEVKVVGLLSSTMAELQTVALVLKCVPFSCSVEVCLNIQATLNACVSELKMGVSDFRNCYWIEKRHIANLVSQKNISVVWSKVKGHSGVVSNDYADVLADIFAHSFLLLLTNVCEHFIMANGMLISGNICYFVYNIFRSVNYTHWEIGSGSKILCGFSVHNINWVRTVAIWHLDLDMLFGSTSRALVSLHSYFMKAVYGRLPVAVRKRLYDKKYPGILCLHCGKIEFSDYVFTCSKKAVFHSEILFKWVAVWRSLAGFCFPVPLVVLEFLLLCVHDIGLYALLCKGFVLVGWFEKAVQIFENHKKAVWILVDFVWNMGM